MKFQFEVRSKIYPDKTWDNTIDFCIDHDGFIPHNYQKVILQIASDYGVYRKLRISRIALRELASKGEIPGMTKSSW